LSELFDVGSALLSGHGELRWPISFSTMVVNGQILSGRV